MEKERAMFNTGVCLHASDNYNNLLIDFCPPPHMRVPIKINYNFVTWSLASEQMMFEFMTSILNVMSN